jgi:hypothetical protein
MQGNTYVSRLITLEDIRRTPNVQAILRLPSQGNDALTGTTNTSICLAQKKWRTPLDELAINAF